MLLLVTLLWVISVTNVHEGKDVPPAPGTTPDPQTFSTYAQCEREMDENINDLERQGLLKRLGKYETESLIPFPYGLKFTQRWECLQKD
jgi:hypothetical protein